MENDLDLLIENRIKEFRKKQHLSQEELADHLGVSRQSIIALEQGRTMPSLPLAVSMCQFFNSAFEEMFDFENEVEESMSQIFNNSSGLPKIDIEDHGNMVVIKAELPGISEEDIDIEVMDNVMTISGEKKAETEGENKGYYYKESHTGSFSRSFTLPSEVVADKAIADMKNGVLTISVPKVAPKQAKKITLKKNR